MQQVNKSHKLNGVCYDIRGPVLEHATRLEEEGHRILKLNIGNPAPFGFDAPDEIIADVIRNLRGAQGYTASKGLFAARKAIMHECQRLDIPNDARHRAMGDAAATAQLFHLLWATPRGPEVMEHALKKGTRESWLPQHVPASDFDALPTGAGVYQMLDQRGTPLYIGMSHQVRTRIRSHFTGDLSSARRQALLRDVHNIIAEPTGSVLYARLLEDVLIRTHWPIHNRAQKHQPLLHTIVSYRDRQGYDRLMVKKARTPRGSIHHLSGAVEARDWLYELARTAGCSPAYFGLGGAADDPEARDAATHNAQLAAALEQALASPYPAHAFLLLPGRAADEAGVVYVAEGRLSGLGWLTGGASENEGFQVLADAVQSVARSGLADALVQGALINPEGIGARHQWRCFDADESPIPFETKA